MEVAAKENKCTHAGFNNIVNEMRQTISEHTQLVLKMIDNTVVSLHQR